MSARMSIRVLFGLLLLVSQGLLSQESMVSGEKIYQERCAYCHGTEGKGDGPPNSALNIKAPDLTSGVYRFRSTESGSIPTDADLIKTISAGLNGTSMPAWKGILTDVEISAVVSHLKTLSPRFAEERPRPVPVPRRTSYPESGIMKGEKYYDQLECASCHGTDGTGQDAIATEFEDEWGNPIVAANLTEPWTFRGGSSDKDVYLRIRTGLDGTPMPSYDGVLSDHDLYDVAQYVGSLARTPAWRMGAEELERHYASLSSTAKESPEQWGKYLVSYLGCRDCHTPVNADGTMMNEYDLAGGQQWTLEPYFTYMYTPNLTPDEETGLGRYTDGQIRDAITRGIRPSDGSRMLPFPMPWPNFAGLTSEDVDAVIAYLKTVPPVSNKIPMHEEPNILSYLGMKIQAVIFGKQYPSFIMAGNAGEQREPSVSQTLPSDQGVQP